MDPFVTIAIFAVTAYVIFYFYRLFKNTEEDAFYDTINAKLQEDGRTLLTSREPDREEWDDGPYDYFQINFLITKGLAKTEKYYRIITFEEAGETKTAWALIKVNIFTGKRVEIKGIKKSWPH